MKMAIKYVLVLAFVALGATAAVADTISMESSADAWGYSGYSSESYNGDTNHGTGTDAYGTRMMASWRDTTSPYDGNYKFWVRFDLSDIVGTADSATLKITMKSPGGGTDYIVVNALDDGDAGESWGEYTITYNNAPGNNLTTNDFDMSRYTYLGAFQWVGAAASDGTVITWADVDLKDAVNADTDGQLTLGFTRAMYYNASSSFYSREDATYAGATLVLTGVTPEPAKESQYL